jgi:hypothetical protein
MLAIKDTEVEETLEDKDGHGGAARTRNVMSNNMSNKTNKSSKCSGFGLDKVEVHHEQAIIQCPTAQTNYNGSTQRSTATDCEKSIRSAESALLD